MQQPQLKANDEQLEKKKIVLFIVAALISSGWYVFTIQNGHFVTDDLKNFNQIADLSFGEYLIKPVGVHIVPLFRAVNYFLHSFFPMSFKVGMAVMYLLYLFSGVYLLLTLQLISPGNKNYIIVLLYFLTPYLFPTIYWWSSALHRVPFVFLTLSSIYYYFKYVLMGGKSNYCLSLLLALTAFGFFVKAIFLPLYLLCMLLVIKKYRINRRQIISIVPYALVSLSYLICIPLLLDSDLNEISQSKIGFKQLFTSLEFSLQFVVYHFLPFANPYVQNWGWFFLTLIGFVLILLKKLDPFALAILFGLLLINHVLILFSPRFEHFGHFILLAPRYYFDQVFIILIFLSLSIRRPEGVSQSVGMSKAIVNFSAISAALIYACFSLSLSLHLVSDGLTKHRLAHQYVRGLKNGVLSYDEPKMLNLKDGYIPQEITGMYMERIKLSTYLALFQFFPDFDNTKSMREVSETGSLLPAKNTQ